MMPLNVILLPQSFTEDQFSSVMGFLVTNACA